MGELSRSTGVPVATVKFYLREGLLHPGERTSANQAQYDESHLRRLRMIKALSEYGGISLAGVRALVEAIETRKPLFDVLGLLEDLLGHDPGPSDSDSGRLAEDSLRQLITDQGWSVVADGAQYRRTLDIMAAFDESGHGDLLRAIAPTYAKLADEIAQVDVRTVPGPSDPEASVEGAVIGIVLGGSLFLALRELAHESVSRDLEF